VLERLLDVHPHVARAIFRASTGFEPCPNAPAVQSWLQEHRPVVGPIVHPAPRTTGTVTLDLSVGSTLLADPVALAGTEELTRIVFGAMDDVRAAIGIGRYDEPRLWYAGYAYADVGGERRTVHLGVDLFLPAGTPVLAPLDAVVESVQNNEGFLDYGPTVVLRHEPDDGPTFYTLYGHLSHRVLDTLTPGQSVQTGDRFAELGEFSENGNWPPHLHFQIITDLLGMSGDYPGVAPASERNVWTSFSPDPNLILCLETSVRYDRNLADRSLRDRRHTLLGRSLSLAYDEPLHIVRGRGVLLYDADGREYLDCVNNVCHVGHSHPRVVSAAHEQMSVLNTNTRYLHENILTYAARLTALLPDPLSVCFFVNSGSEANDLALRIARTVTGRDHIIVIEGAYHGTTQALIDASPYKHDGPGGTGPAAWIHSIPMPDPYRGLYRDEDASAERYAAHVQMVAQTMAAAGHSPAAFIAESFLGCGGQIEPPPTFLQRAFRHAREAGALCIADEVQVGFGRLGTHFWGFETQGAIPDIVTMGKPMGNGHPLGAVVTTRQIADAFANGMEYFNTFGGNPVSCAVGLAVLDTVRDDSLQLHADRMGHAVKDALRRLADIHPIIGEVRGRGLFLGIELVLDRDRRTPAPAQAHYVVERLRHRGVLLSTDGPDDNVLKFKPPLVFDRPEMERLVTALDRTLAEDYVRMARDS
jgi:4-aminobutyrate aminotransferase-like enzyme